MKALLFWSVGTSPGQIEDVIWFKTTQAWYLSVSQETDTKLRLDHSPHVITEYNLFW